MKNRKLFLPLLLIFFTQIGFSQTTTTKTEAEKSDELKKQAVEFLRETGQEVNNLRTLENRISFSGEIAGLMWFHDEKEARKMYQTTITDFRQLLFEINTQFNALSVAEQTDNTEDNSIYGGTSSTAVILRKFEKAMGVRRQIALSIAEHDAQMGYEFFTSTAQIINNPRLINQFTSADFYFETRLIDLMAEQDVDKALEAARKLLATGKTIELLGLLNKIYEKDDKKGAAFGEELLAKIKSLGVKDGNFYSLSTILNLGWANLEKIKATPDKKPMFSQSSLREIADLLAQEILKLNEKDFADAERFAAIIENFLPARAAQIRLKFKDSIKSNNNSTQDQTTVIADRNTTQNKNVEDQQEKLIEDVKKLADKKLSKEEREKIIAQARQIISKVKDREQKVVALSLLATQVANFGDKELALEIMTEARNLMSLQPKNYKDYLSFWMLAGGYAQIDTEKAFPILEDMVFRLNETITAFIKVGEFIDVNGDFIEDGEVQVGSFGGDLTRSLLQSLDAANATLSKLAQADFERTKLLTNKFDRLEVRILAKMLVLRAILGNKNKESDKEETDI
ncbi:hypothetical protein BH10ACI1_BH10ACI1_17740 [soil metagenome]